MKLKYMKSHTKISLFSKLDVWRSVSKHVKINSVNPLYLIINKVNRYFEEINKNKYLTLVSTNESKEKIKKIWRDENKIKDLIRSVTKNSDDYDKNQI